jgi:hypothetical protein
MSYAKAPRRKENGIENHNEHKGHKVRYSRSDYLFVLFVFFVVSLDPFAP